MNDLQGTHSNELRAWTLRILEGAGIDPRLAAEWLRPKRRASVDTWLDGSSDEGKLTYDEVDRLIRIMRVRHLHPLPKLIAISHVFGVSREEIQAEIDNGAVRCIYGKSGPLGHPATQEAVENDDELRIAVMDVMAHMFIEHDIATRN